jgi:PAS domain S-box-containing protein
MSPDVQLEVLALLASTVILAALTLYGGVRYREVSAERSTLLFTLLVGTCALWSMFHAGELVSTTRSTMLVWRQLTKIPAYLVPLIWFLFMLVYTDADQHLTRWRLACLSTPPAIAILLFSFAPGLMWPTIETATYQDREILDLSVSPVYIAFTTYSYLLTTIGIMLAGRMVLRGKVRHRRQGLALAFGATIPLFANVAFLGGYIPHPSLDPVPISFTTSGLLLGYAIFRYDMLSLAPIAHRAAFQTLPDLVAVFDEEQRVVDLNPTGQEMFGVNEDPTGKPAQEIFSSYPDLVQRLFDLESVETELTLVLDGELKHFSVTSRPVRFRSQHRGTLLILRDVTELKEREQDLELLKRIQSRVLRHNIRNDLQVIGGLAHTIASTEDGQTEERASNIVEQVRQLSETTEKAQQIEAIIDASDDRIDQDISQVVERIVEKARQRYPGAKIETETPGTAWAMAHGDLEAAVWNLVENAIIHSDSAAAAVEVSVRTTDTSVSVRVEDNGPGIPAHEIDVLKQQSESALQHGSGAGLWLVNWIAEMSAGSLAFDTAGNGTTVHLQLPAAEHSLTDSSPEQPEIGQRVDSSPMQEQ